MKKLYAISPSHSLAGGVAKILDYATHASLLGYESYFVTLNDGLHRGTLRKKPYYLKNKGEIKFCNIADINPSSDDVIFFSLPSNYSYITNRFSGIQCKLVHLIQNVRHANIFFQGGCATDILGLPMTRICITQEVQDAIEPWVLEKERCYLVPHGFDFDYFVQELEGAGKTRLSTVLYNTFKSGIGRIIKERYQQRGGMASFIEIGSGIKWDDLRKAYHSADIFIGTPLLEEGLYLPAMEAMAAGNLTIVPDAKGNRFYCDFGKNCIQVEYGDIDAYVNILLFLTDSNNLSPYTIKIMKAGQETVRDLGLSNERKLFGSILEQL